jgi:ribonuclease P protein component
LIDPLNLQNSGHDSTFGKEYKLCSKRVIDELFETGATLKQYPLRLLYIKKPVHFSKNTAFQIVISVPKKKIRKAHDRNKVKRIIRELIRKNKHELENILEIQNDKLAIFLIYSESTILEYALLEKKLNKLIHQLENSIRNEKA